MYWIFITIFSVQYVPQPVLMSFQNCLDLAEFGVVQNVLLDLLSGLMKAVESLYYTPVCY